MAPPTDRRAVLVPGWDARDVRLAAHAANLAVARATPGEQPYVVGWDLRLTAQGYAVVLDVDDDPLHRARWLGFFPDTASLQRAEGQPVAEEAEVRVVRLPLDERSVDAQRARDGLLDRFHVTSAVATDFGSQARAWVGRGALYCLESAGVRTWWPESPLEPPLGQTLDDVAAGYGGPVGWAVTAVDDDGWRRVGVEALGVVSWTSWSAVSDRSPTLGS